MIFVLGFLFLGAVISLILGKHGVILAIIVLIFAVIINALPPILNVESMLAQVRGKYKKAFRLQLISYYLCPTAPNRYLLKVLKLFLQVYTGQLTHKEAYDQIVSLEPSKRINDQTIHRASTLFDALPFIYLSKKEDRNETLKIVDLSYITRPQVPIGLGHELYITQMCEDGYHDKAEKLIATMERSTIGEEIIVDGYHNRARITYLAFLGCVGRVSRFLRLGSILSVLFSRRDRARLRQIAVENKKQSFPCEFVESADSISKQLDQESILSNHFTYLRRPTIIVFILLIINLIVHGIVSHKGSPYDPEHLLQYGAMLKAYVLDGDWWRTFSSMFLHAGPVHLIPNMIFLLIFGTILERLIGSFQFAAIYLFSGLVGSLATVVLSQGKVSVGSSGAVFGILGAGLVIVLLKRLELPRRWTSRSINFFVSFLLFNIILGISIKFISNTTHMGGLVGGAGLAGLLFIIKSRTNSMFKVLGIAVTIGTWIVFCIYSIKGVAGITVHYYYQRMPLTKVKSSTYHFSLTDGYRKKTVFSAYPASWHMPKQRKLHRLLHGEYALGKSGTIFLDEGISCGLTSKEKNFLLTNNLHAWAIYLNKKMFSNYMPISNSQSCSLIENHLNMNRYLKGIRLTKNGIIRITIRVSKGTDASKLIPLLKRILEATEIKSCGTVKAEEVPEIVRAHFRKKGR